MQLAPDCSYMVRDRRQVMSTMWWGVHRTEQPLSNKLLFNWSYLCAISRDSLSIPVYDQNTHIQTSVLKAEKTHTHRRLRRGTKTRGVCVFLGNVILTRNDGALLLSLSHVMGKYGKPYDKNHVTLHMVQHHTHSEMDTLQQRTIRDI